MLQFQETFSGLSFLFNIFFSLCFMSSDFPTYLSSGISSQLTVFVAVLSSAPWIVPQDEEGLSKRRQKATKESHPSSPTCRSHGTLRSFVLYIYFKYENIIKDYRNNAFVLQQTAVLF